MGNSPIIAQGSFGTLAKAASPATGTGQTVVQRTEVDTQGRDLVFRETNQIVTSEFEIPSAKNNLFMSQKNLTSSQVHGARKNYLPIETGDFEHAKFASAIKQDRFRAREGISAEKLKMGSTRVNLAGQEGGLGIDLRNIKPVPLTQATGCVNSQTSSLANQANNYSNQATGYVNQVSAGGPMTITRTVVETPNVTHGNNPAYQPIASGLGQQNSLRSFQVDPFSHPTPITFPKLGIASPQGNLQGLAAAGGAGGFTQGGVNPSRFKIENDAFEVPHIVQPTFSVETRPTGLLSNQPSARMNEVDINSPTYPVQPNPPNMSAEYPASSLTSSLKIGELAGNFGAKIDRTYATYNPTPLSPIVSPETANLRIADNPNQIKLNSDGLHSNYNVDMGIRKQNTNDIIAHMKPPVYQADIQTPVITPKISPINQLNVQNEFTPRDADVVSQIRSPTLGQFNDLRTQTAGFQNNAQRTTDAFQGPDFQVNPVPTQSSPFANLRNGIEIGSSSNQVPPATFPQASPAQAGSSITRAEYQTSNSNQTKPVHYLDTVNIGPTTHAPQPSPGIFQNIKDKIIGTYKDHGVHNQHASISNGYGTVTVPGEYTYEGLFVNGKYHGNGSIKYPDGTTFVGEFKNDRKEGHGRLYAASGKIIREGLWINDQPI
jgi:hypothetical protein